MFNFGQAKEASTQRNAYVVVVIGAYHKWFGPASWRLYMLSPILENVTWDFALAISNRLLHEQLIYAALLVLFCVHHSPACHRLPSDEYERRDVEVLDQLAPNFISKLAAKKRWPRVSSLCYKYINSSRLPFPNLPIWFIRATCLVQRSTS